MPIKRKTISKRKTTKKKNEGKKVGFTALAVAAVAGAYFLYGSKDSVQNKKKVKGWMLRAKGEVLEKIEKMKHIDEEDYKKIVDIVSTKYKKLKTVSVKEMTELSKDLKDHWKHIDKDVHEPED